MFNEADRTIRSSPAATVEQQRHTEDPDAEVIAAAAAARQHNSAITSPPKRPVPVKRMKPVPAKRISMDKKTYVATVATDGGDSTGSVFLEQFTEQSAVEGSDRGEEVESPVSAVERRSREKRRRRDSGGSTSRSSSASSATRSTKRRSNGSSKDNEKRRKKSKKSHRRSRTMTRELPSRSPSRSPSPAKSVGSVQRADTPARLNSGSNRTPKETPTKTASVTDLSVVDIVVANQPDTAMAMNNGLFKTMLCSKADYPHASADMDSVSRVSKRSQKRAFVPRRTMDLKELEHYLPAELQGLALTRKTVSTVSDVYKTMKPGILTDTLRNIIYVPVDIPNDPTTMEATRYPQIDGRNYMFYACKSEFGYDYETLVRKNDLTTPSLLNALRPMCKRGKDSLDMVFRSALKELTEEIHGFEDDADTTLENPRFVSGRYVELRLLKKIKEHYTKTTGQNIVKYLTDSCPDTNSPLRPLVDKSSCEMYLRKLYDRYELKSKDFDKAVAEYPSTPVKMRVWTDPSSQTAANVQISNFIGAVYEESIRKWEAMSEDEKANQTMYKVFIADYAAEMKAFIKTHGRLLSEMLRASELMTYLCFGLTTNAASLGTGTMATSYYMARNGKSRSSICWNYPLEIIHRKEPVSAVEQPVFTLEEYFDGLDELLSAENDE